MTDQLVLPIDQVGAAHLSRWLAIGRALGPPSDIPACESAVAATYGFAGLPPPSKIVWVRSPLAGALLVMRMGFRGMASAPAVERMIRDSGEEMEPDIDRASARLGWMDCVETGIAGRMHLAWQQLRLSVIPGGRGVPRESNLYDLYRSLVREIDGRFLAPVSAAVHKATGEMLRPPLPGHFDAARLAVAEWMSVHRGKIPWRAFAGQVGVAEQAGWWWPMTSFAVMSERPAVLNLDDRGRMHSESGPAMSWSDGFALFGWHGVPVPREFITLPGLISLEMIQREPNAELRRVLIARYGESRYLGETGAVEISRDSCGVLYRRNIGGEGPWEVPLLLLRVENSTVEPDGSRAVYWLKVPAGMRTPREAVAWSFGLTEAEYVPEAES